MERYDSMQKNKSKAEPKGKQSNNDCADKDYAEKYGFEYNEYGEVKGLNPNIYIAEVLKKDFKVVYNHSSDSFYQYRNNVYKQLDDNTVHRKLRNILNGIVPNSWTLFRENGYMAVLRRMARRVEFDSDTSKVNFKNGIFDLNTYQLEPHSEQFLSTIQIPINVDLNADCPLFKKTLCEIFECSINDEMIKLVGEMFGYCLTSETKACRAFILVGMGGNGKSLLCNILRSLVGDENVSALPLRDFESSFRRLKIVGKSVNLVTENEFGRKGFHTESFKQIVSGDLISAEIKGGRVFDFKPSAKLIFAMNRLPNTPDKSYGLYRRLIILPFNRTFSGNEENKMLEDELQDELQGILTFAIRGLKRLRKNNFNFTIPEKSQKALDIYFDEIDPIRIFARQFVCESPKGRIFNKDAYSRYVSWATNEGERNNISQTEFSHRFKSALRASHVTFTSGGSNKSGGDRYLGGIKFKK